MLLKKLIKNISPKAQNIKIKGLEIDSKKIKKGFIFFAIKGQNFNGERYIKEAIKKGAAVIVCSRNCKFSYNKIPIIKTSDIRFFLSEISSMFYKLKPKNIIAVTGTNGKTSVADLYYQILKLNNLPVASIGTLGIKYNGKIIKSNLTSPDTITIHKTLSKIKKCKIDNVILEASSHGLHQKRINHLNINTGIFTNFSQDHLDYHKNMKSYLNSKLLLFKNILSKKKFAISDSSIKEFKILKKISRQRNLRLIEISSIKNKLDKFLNYKLNTFQSKNLSMAITAAKLSKLSEKKIFDILKKLRDINGRLELVRTFPSNIKIYIDFAHTPDALLNVLKVIKSSNENVSLVFGCGGDRDSKKRPLMGKIASKYCKKIYVTDDNPRNENPEKIRREIIKNIKKKYCFNIGNREKAIKTSIINADPDEVVLVAGKGHESEQIYKNKIISISDKQIIKKINLKIDKSSKKDQNFKQNKNILINLCKLRKVKNFHGLAIDSREVKKDNLFITIKGKKNDGIKFASKAFKKGAKYIISSKKLNKYKTNYIKVDNEIKFLNNFAFLKRKKSIAKIIAITGSAGKTSLKNLIKNLLVNFDNTYCSPKSYNNHFGVPISLSHLKASHKYAVFEVGMSKAGEINTLTKLIRPHIGIITNIGEAHIENFKNLNSIAKAKGELIDNILSNGTIILNRDDKFFNTLKIRANSKNLKIVTFGMSKNANIRVIKITKKNSINFLKIKYGKQFLFLKTKNINIYNILSSLALLKTLNLDVKKITNLFKNFEPTEGRGKIYNVKRYRKKFKLIDESYNANPLSVKNAIKNFKLIKKQNFKKYLLLGDMLELGKKSEKLHKDLSKVINNSDIDKVFIKGQESLNTYMNIDKNKRGNILQKEEDLDFSLNKIIANNDYLMVKGSNATGLNKLCKKIIKGY